MNPVPGYDDGLWLLGTWVGIPVAVLLPIFVVWGLASTWRDARSVATEARKASETVAGSWGRASSKPLFTVAIAALLGLIIAWTANAYVRWFDWTLRQVGFWNLLVVDGNGDIAQFARNTFLAMLSVVGIAIAASSLGWTVPWFIAAAAIGLVHLVCYPSAILSGISALLQWGADSAQEREFTNFDPLWLLAISAVLGLATIGLLGQLTVAFWEPRDGKNNKEFRYGS